MSCLSQPFPLSVLRIYCCTMQVSVLVVLALERVWTNALLFSLLLLYDLSFSSWNLLFLYSQFAMYVKFRKAMIHKKSNMSYMHPKTLYMVSSPFHIEFMGVRELKKKVCKYSRWLRNEFEELMVWWEAKREH